MGLRIDTSGLKNKKKKLNIKYSRSAKLLKTLTIYGFTIQFPLGLAPFSSLRE